MAGEETLDEDSISAGFIQETSELAEKRKKKAKLS